MPIYEYSCLACNHNFDVLQKISDELLTECPECGKPQLKKMLSAPNFRLKGKGWYETDFKSGNKRNLAGDSESSATSKTSDDNGKGKSAGSDSVKADKSAKDSTKTEKKTSASSSPKSASD